MEIADGLGERMRRLRVAKGMTQAQLAEPYSAPYVSQIERGRRAPRPDVLALFAKRLGVTVEQLSTGLPATFEPEAVLHLQEGWEALYVGRYGDARRAFKAATRIADEFRQPVIGARATVGLGRCAEYEGQFADALPLYRRALEAFQEVAPAPAAVEAVAGIARCLQMSGDTRLALHVLENYLLELDRQELSDPTALMRVHASLVWPYMELGLYKMANQAAATALKLQSSVESPEEVAGMHLNTARALMKSGLHEDALTSLRKAEEIFQDLNWQTEIARAQTNQGIVLMEAGELAEAATVLRRALATYRRVGFVRGEARTLNELARLERLMGDTTAAKATASQAVQLLSEMEAIPESALAYRELGLALRKSDPARAEKHLRQAIGLYERCGEHLHAADTYRLLGELLHHRAPLRSAAAFHEGLKLVAAGLDRVDSA